jgi:ribosomal protein S18 acetylase RimI-like enzyme
MADPFFHNLVWNALHTVHSHFAIASCAAARYPADVVPYAALADPTHADPSPLEEFLSPNEHVYLIGTQPSATSSLRVGPPLQCFQMVYSLEPPLETEAERLQVLPMSPPDAPAMVALTDLAFRGFFRPRTNHMGSYYGIRINNKLVAMAGERLAIPGFCEISAVCTHPSYTGRGYATMLMHRLLSDHAGAKIKSFLHVSEKNSRAIALYERMGFSVVNSVALWPVSLAI